MRLGLADGVGAAVVRRGGVNGGDVAAGADGVGQHDGGFALAAADFEDVRARREGPRLGTDLGSAADSLRPVS